MGAEVRWVRRLRRMLPKWVYELLELSYSMVAYSRLARAARAFRPDVIYERYNLFLLAGLLLKKRRRIPLLLEVNAPLAEERHRFGGGLGLAWLARWAEGLAWRGADVVLPVTRVLAEHVRARGVPSERLAVVPNGINIEHFGGAPPPDAAKARLDWSDRLVLGFTGFVRDWHGVDRVLHWLAQPGAPSNAVLLVVGDGPERGNLERLARELGIAGRVRFTGVVPRADVPALVSAFDIALQPAVVPYASPLKLFEYLALGKAIVAPRQPNIEEVLEDGVNARLFDDSRPGSLAAALTELANDGSLRRDLGLAAAATIPRLGLTWRRNAERVASLAEQLPAPGPGVPLQPSI
jgi:glycosyltransferase involved in cell wall biosynthesis